jgi:dienelactone hydrolase
MYNWETRLTTRDENRIVRPVEWGFDWVEKYLKLAGVQADESMSKAEALAAFEKLNQWIIADPHKFFDYERPTDFRLEKRFPQLFPTNVRPETLAQDAELREKAERGQLDKAEFLRFTSPERTPYPENDLVNARWYPAAPHKDAKRPKQAIIILPQWNADAFSHNALAEIFNKFGISALRLSKPYHDIRRPSELERADYAVSSNLGRTLSACRQAVVDIRCCIDWLETQGYEHFGVLGTSLGSCYTYLASTMDERIQVNAFNHASTAFGDVVWSGQSTRHIRQALEDAGFSQAELRHAWDGISPMNYYQRFSECGLPAHKKKVLLVYAQYDLTFPLQYSLEVKRAFADHNFDFECRVLPCGHYTTGETPYKYIDGWYLGSFVYRAFKSLRSQT